jgi:ABC-type iron transport system FetAB ATPase subunit
MFRALTGPSSGGKIVFTHHLVSSLSVNVCTVYWLRADCRFTATGKLKKFFVDN